MMELLKLVSPLLAKWIMPTGVNKLDRIVVSVCGRPVSGISVSTLTSRPISGLLSHSFQVFVKKRTSTGKMPRPHPVTQIRRMTDDHDGASGLDRHRFAVPR